MGKKYLIDSNVNIDYAAGLLPQKASDFAENIFNTDFLISVAAKIEVLGFNHLPAKLNEMEEFINSASIIPSDDKIVERTILLRRKYKKIKLGDSIIAATAMLNNFTLVTRNVADFKYIYGLRILNPWDNN